MGAKLNIMQAVVKIQKFTTVDDNGGWCPNPHKVGGLVVVNLRPDWKVGNKVEAGVLVECEGTHGFGDVNFEGEVIFINSDLFGDLVAKFRIIETGEFFTVLNSEIPKLDGFVKDWGVILNGERLSPDNFEHEEDGDFLLTKNLSVFEIH